MLHADTPAQEPRAVKILDRVLRISPVLELAEPVGPGLIPLDDDIPDPSVALEQFLYVSLARIIGDTSEIDFILAHF